MENLKTRTIRGGLARMLAQVANFALRLATLMVLARLLEPNDFGIVGMVTAFTGALALFRDFGLSSAVIQRTVITQEQLSTLFWINIVVGLGLTVMTMGVSPAIAALYNEPRLVGVTMALALGFIFNAFGVQHGALLQREMRFTALAIINAFSLVLAGGIAILGASLGFGYWALVVMALVAPLGTTVGTWMVAGWIPGKPRGKSGIRSMVHFGGIVTANSLIVYLASNLDKVLVGRFCGIEALGFYGRAYQLVSIPIDNLNSAAGEVAFSALSRVKDDAVRLKSYFLKGYSLLLVITVPITIACALMAEDLVYIALGGKWIEVTPIFRWLAPTILASAIVNPLGWFIYSSGMASRGLKMALVLAPIMTVSYLLGLRFGALGVACAYSVATLLWILPAVAWAVRGTNLSVGEVLGIVQWPLISGIASGGVAFGIGLLCQDLSPLMRLAIQSIVLLLSYALLLLLDRKQRALYRSTFLAFSQIDRRTHA